VSTRPSARPYVVLSCSLSLDGYLDDATHRRLVLSNRTDLDRVDDLRACSDAILVGAGTVRADNPRLLVRSPERRARRTARGESPDPMKVTVTRSGRLDPDSCFFRTGEGERLVFGTASAAHQLRARVGDTATVLAQGESLSMGQVTEVLGRRGVRKLLVEGGSEVHTQFLTEGLADELQMVVAPLFVGDSRAPRFVGDGCFPWDSRHRARLAAVRQIGDVVLLRYALSERFCEMPEVPARAT
jgi:5-amino-6-(5-phosphoribosylamino)uracil reductase